MRKYQAIAFVVAVLFFMTLAASTVSAQLVLIDRRSRVVKVDKQKDRIEVTTLEGNPNRTVGYIYINENTKVYDKNRRLISWTSLRHGWVIRVKGGLRVDSNTNAQRIYVLAR
jgi:hypothetical protein